MTELFEPEYYELEQLKITEINKQTYYASVYGNTVKIYTVAPIVAPLVAAQPKSLFDLINDNVKNYDLGTGDTPNDAVPFYVITGQLGDLNDYKVSDNLYILPSLTPDRIDAKVNENKVAVEKAEEERLKTVEAERIAAETAAEQERLAKVEADRLAKEKAETDRLKKVEADRLAAEQVAEQEQMKTVDAERIKAETDRIETVKQGICITDYLKDGDIYIENKLIDYDCFIHFENVKKIILKNVSNIKYFFYNIKNLVNIEEIEIISDNHKKVLEFATEFNPTITEINISILLSNLKKLKKIKLEYMIDEKRATIFLSALTNNIYSLESVSICPSSEYFKNMREKFKNTKNAYIAEFIHEGKTFFKKTSTETILKQIQENIDKLLKPNPIIYTENPIRGNKSILGNSEINKAKVAENAEKERLTKAEQEQLAKVESDKLAAENTEKERLTKAEQEQEQLAKVRADKLAAEKASLANIDSGNITKIITSKDVDISPEEMRIKNWVKPSTNPLPPPPPSKEDQETTRITKLLQVYRTNITHLGYRKGLPNSTTTSLGVSQTNACYINAMLQMFIDIDEFLEYILFMNETKKQQELDKLIKDATDLADTFSTIVGVTENLPEFLLFVYNVLKTKDQPQCNDNCTELIIALMKPENSNVDFQILMVQNIIQMFGFPTSEDTTKNKINDSYPRQLTSDFKNNSNEDITLIDDNTSVFDYNKYIEFGNLFGVINYNVNDFNMLNFDQNGLPSSLQCLSDLKDKLVKIKDFEIKHQIITALKQIFEFVINGIPITNNDDPVITAVIVEVNNIQRLINLSKGQQEDASAVYSLLNSKFNDELFQKYGLNYNKDGQMFNLEFFSPLNLQVNDNRPLSEAIKNNVSMKDENKDNQRYIIFGNSQSSNKFDQITLQGKTFKPIGIVQHEGVSSKFGSTGGHYVYYSFKSNKLLNDEKVSDTSFTSNISYTRCVVLYERVEPLLVGSSGNKITPGGNRGSSSSGKNPTKFRASRRKQIKKAPSI